MVPGTSMIDACTMMNNASTPMNALRPRGDGSRANNTSSTAYTTPKLIHWYSGGGTVGIQKIIIRASAGSTRVKAVATMKRACSAVSRR